MVLNATTLEDMMMKRILFAALAFAILALGSATTLSAHEGHDTRSWVR